MAKSAPPRPDVSADAAASGDCTSGDAAICTASDAEGPNRYMAPELRAANMTAQMAICTKPTRATPMILPIIIWKGDTLDTMISMMRLVFSSITPDITMPPYERTNV